MDGYYWRLKVGAKYDPNQPRVPAGDPRGGQWTAEGGGGAWSPGPDRDARRADGVYDVISETDADTAAILLTQGVEPSFKPRIAPVTEYAPGRGLERDGLYVANDEAFSRGSFGRVRLYMTAGKGSLKSPAEMEQLGRTDVDDALGTENGAVTVGKLGKDTFAKVAVWDGGAWKEMSPDEFLRSIGVDPGFRELPSVPAFEAKLRDLASSLYLREDDVLDMVHDYNRASLQDKDWLASEIGL